MAGQTVGTARFDLEALKTSPQILEYIFRPPLVCRCFVPFFFPWFCPGSHCGVESSTLFFLSDFTGDPVPFPSAPLPPPSLWMTVGGVFNFFPVKVSWCDADVFFPFSLLHPLPPIHDYSIPFLGVTTFSPPPLPVKGEERARFLSLPTR